MTDAKSLLAVTFVVITAGTAIYTIKTYMQPGMKIAINLAELKELAEDNYEPLRQSTHITKITTTPPAITTQTPSKVTEALRETTTSKVETTTAYWPKTTTLGRLFQNRPSLEESEVNYAADFEENQREIEGPPIVPVKRRDFAETKLGDIQGVTQDVGGKKVYAFLGVRYAQPPIGDLRFKKPRPAKLWRGVKAAKDYGPPCVQYFPNVTDLPITFMRKDFSEDCLHLNIWTPSTEKPMKPVMVYIHGGLFTFGSNSVDETDGRVLAALEDVVVVTINYRLGPFGFISPNTDDVPGNMGLHDMLAALKWIKDNIRAFGGDDSLITIVGHSSGAMATTMFITSPVARNLFKRAILQSGTSTVFNFYYQRSFQATEDFAEMLGCADGRQNLTTNPDAVMKCVREMPIQRLRRATEDQLSDQLYSYSPTIGDEIMPRPPKETVDDEQLFGEQKEILVGTNADEGALFFHLGNPEMFRRDKAPTIKDINEAKSLLATSLKDWGLSKSTLKLLNSFFLEKTKSVEPKVILKAMYDVFGDLAFTCPSVYFAEKFAEKNRSSYYYYYTHSSSAQKGGQWMGATHFDEVPFVFGHPLRYPHKYTGNDIDFSKKMMNIWATFARNGKPPAINGVDWPEYSADNQEYIELNAVKGHMGIGLGPHKENCDTWKYAFRLFN